LTSDKPRNTPYHCTLCLTEKNCGYHGILRFPNAEVPTCDHHTNASDEKTVTPMVPVVK
jgi:hypothetical protein